MVYSAEFALLWRIGPAESSALLGAPNLTGRSRPIGGRAGGYRGHRLQWAALLPSSCPSALARGHRSKLVSAFLVELPWQAAPLPAHRTRRKSGPDGNCNRRPCWSRRSHSQVVTLHVHLTWSTQQSRRPCETVIVAGERERGVSLLVASLLVVSFLAAASNPARLERYPI